MKILAISILPLLFLTSCGPDKTASNNFEFRDLGVIGEATPSGFRTFVINVDGRKYLVVAGKDKIAITDTGCLYR